MHLTPLMWCRHENTKADMSKQENKALQEKIRAMDLEQLVEYKKVGDLANRVIGALGVALLLLCLNFPTILMVIVTSIFVPFLAVLSSEMSGSLDMIQERIDKLDK